MHVIRGTIHTTASEVVADALAGTSFTVDRYERPDTGELATWFTAEVEEEVAFMIDICKGLVDTYTGRIDWHECTHADPASGPCVIAGLYEVGG